MATDIEICSNALMLLGDRPIASLSEGTKQAILCANLYPLARKEVLRSHVWNCAVKRVQLAALAAAPAYGWTHQFAKPGDWLRLLDVGECGQDEYAFEGNRILANQSSLKVRYLADITEGYWDFSLVDVMVKRMEAGLAYPITKSTTLAQMKEQIYRGALRAAKAIDGQENPPEQYGDTPFLSVRGGQGYA